jgi:hypothetical protein
MDPATHTFPLPDVESGKLAVLSEDLSHQTGRLKLRDTVRANPWRSMLTVFSIGFLLSFLSRRFVH